MNFFPLVGVSLGLLLGYISIRYIIYIYGKKAPSIGELMYPLHHTDSKIDKANQRKGKR